MVGPGPVRGQVQDQAYGYLFPMGPFFGLGHWMGLPEGVVQRLWVSVLLCLALVGVDRPKFVPPAMRF